MTQNKFAILFLTTITCECITLFLRTMNEDSNYVAGKDLWLSDKVSTFFSALTQIIKAFFLFYYESPPLTTSSTAVQGQRMKNPFMISSIHSSWTNSGFRCSELDERGEWKLAQKLKGEGRWGRMSTFAEAVPPWFGIRSSMWALLYQSVNRIWVLII